MSANLAVATKPAHINGLNVQAAVDTIAAVDEELGIVLMRLDFGDTNSYGPGNALTCFEAFKVYGGQIHAVEAFIRIMPANTPSGWNYEVRKPK